MDPGQNLAGATPNINLSNLTSYYSSCQGYNPVLTTLSTSTTAAQTTSTILSNITGTTTDSCTTSLSSEVTLYYFLLNLIMTRFLLTVETGVLYSGKYDSSSFL
jgi:hypothetical protein